MYAYDLKMGYSCNNKCLHCVMETHKQSLIKHTQKIDCTTDEIFEIMKSDEFIAAKEIVLTGGEPTVRKDFFDIVNFIHSQYPDKYIAVQTNGKLLEPYLEKIFDLDANIHYVIALHGFQDTHNKIVGDKSIGSYNAVFSAIMKIKQLYGDIFNQVCTIKTVLSSANYLEIPDLCDFLYENGIKKFDISYPHLNGFFEVSPEYATTIAISYKQLRETIPRYITLAQNKDFNYFFEEFPRCVFRDNKGVLMHIPDNISIVAPATKVKILVKYHEEDLTQNYNLRYLKMHRKPDDCKICILADKCLGVWDEAFQMFNSEGLSPILAREWILCEKQGRNG